MASVLSLASLLVLVVGSAGSIASPRTMQLVGASGGAPTNASVRDDERREDVVRMEPRQVRLDGDSAGPEERLVAASKRRRAAERDDAEAESDGNEADGARASEETADTDGEAPRPRRPKRRDLDESEILPSSRTPLTGSSGPRRSGARPSSGESFLEGAAAEDEAGAAGRDDSAPASRRTASPRERSRTRAPATISGEGESALQGIRFEKPVKSYDDDLWREDKGGKRKGKGAGRARAADEAEAPVEPSSGRRGDAAPAGRPATPSAAANPSPASAPGAVRTESSRSGAAAPASPRAADPKAAEPRAGELRAEESKAAGPKAGEPKAAETRAPREPAVEPAVERPRESPPEPARKKPKEPEDHDDLRNY